MIKLNINLYVYHDESNSGKQLADSVHCTESMQSIAIIWTWALDARGGIWRQKQYSQKSLKCTNNQIRQTNMVSCLCAPKSIKQSKCVLWGKLGKWLGQELCHWSNLWAMTNWWFSRVKSNANQAQAKQRNPIGKHSLHDLATRYLWGLLVCGLHRSKAQSKTKRHNTDNRRTACFISHS